jgi:hypothetical protein
MKTHVFVYISSIENDADVSLFATLGEAFGAALGEACDEYADPEDYPEELARADAHGSAGEIELGIEALVEHYDNNGVDDEFITITRVPLPGHTDDADVEPEAAE